MNIKSFQKAPDEVLDYAILWADWLASGETISSATWTVPAGLTQPFDPVLSGSTATVWIGGGTLMTDYTVTCHITTSVGRQASRYFTMKVRP